MVEKIDMQKIFSPISPTAEVKKLKGRHTNTKDRRFGRKLQDEEEKNKKRKQTVKQTFETNEKNDVKKNGGERLQTDNRDEKNFDRNNKADKNTRGKLIDVLV